MQNVADDNADRFTTKVSCDHYGKCIPLPFWCWEGFQISYLKTVARIHSAVSLKIALKNTFYIEMSNPRRDNV